MQNFEIDSTVRTADAMWARFREEMRNAEFAKKSPTDKISFLQSVGYSEFITKYAVPTRYMVMYGEYNSKAFTNYLRRLKTVGYSSKEDWIDRQADYVKMLYRALNPHCGARDAGEAWRLARESVKNEMDSFETDYEKAKAKADERRAQALADNRATLISLLARKDQLVRIESICDSIMAPPAPAVPEPVATTEPAEPAGVAAEPPVPEPAPAGPTLTETQRRNAARRRRDKLRKAQQAVAAAPTPKRDDAREARRAERREAERRAALQKKEAEKERMRQKWEAARRPAARAAPVPMQDDPDSVPDLPDE